MPYDEIQDSEGQYDYHPGRGPRVVRDCQMVNQVAAHPSDFIGHARPRYFAQRDEHWRGDVED